MEFPLYRISKNGKNLYRVESMHTFTELQYIGEKILRFTIEAKTYPEMVRIRELIAMDNDACEELRGGTFETLMDQLPQTPQ